MNFYSYEFFAFIIMYALLYYLLPVRIKVVYLIFLSLLFYMLFDPLLVIIPVYLIIISYLFGRILAKKHKKIFLFIPVILNICPLLFFKYFNFFSINVNELGKLIGWNYNPLLLKIALPIGISFYTFKAISYLIEVYRNNIPAEKRLHYVALYILFFPSLLAGPIDRPKPMFEQFGKLNDTDPKFVKLGLVLFLWGLFQKVIVADRLSVLVNRVFDYPPEFHTFHFIIAAFFFAIQIYCDFSGYTDMAIGTAMLFGIKLMKNFDKPYSSVSVIEFWRRWHISLSSWFRDYIFLHVTYSLVRKIKLPVLNIKPEMIAYSCSIFIVMVTAGLWHGAAWTFLIWGALFAVYIITSLITKNIRKRILYRTGLIKHKTFLKIFRTVFVFLLITFAWIFFRANTVNDAFYIVKEIFTGLPSVYDSLININYELSFKMIGLNPASLILCFAGFVIIIFYNLLPYNSLIYTYINRQKKIVKYAGFALFVLFIFLFGNFSTPQFIYFNF